MNLLSIGTVIAAGLYLWTGLTIIRAMKGEGSAGATWIRWPILVAVLLQGATLYAELFKVPEVHLGLGYVAASVVFFAVIIFLVETWIHRLHAQFGIMLLVAAAGALFPLCFPGTPIIAAEWSPLFRWHLLTAIAGYSFMIIALIQAVLLTLQNRSLKHIALEKEEDGFLTSLPGLVVMERIFFRILALGFVCISLTLVLGALATHEMFDVWVRFDHKTVLTWTAWAVFAILLLGRYFGGWRARHALGWFWVGFGTFMLAYFGYRLIIELFGLR